MTLWHEIIDMFVDLDLFSSFSSRNHLAQITKLGYDLTSFLKARRKVLLGWLVVKITLRAVWRFFIMDLGGLCVMTHGT